MSTVHPRASSNLSLQLVGPAVQWVIVILRSDLVTLYCAQHFQSGFMKCLLATNKHSLQATRLTYGLAYVTCPVMRPIHLNQDMVSRYEYVSTEKAIAGDVVQIVAHSQTGEHTCHITLVCGAHAAFNVLLECLQSKCTSVISLYAFHATTIMPCCCLRRSEKGLICRCNQYTS